MNNDLPRARQTLDLQQYATIMATLKHRMAVATANHDDRLLSLLASEQAQLESAQRHRHPVTGQNKIAQIWHRLEQVIADRTQLSVVHTTDTTGQEWWHVEDPRTGKTFQAESLNIALHWIEENRLGR